MIRMWFEGKWRMACRDRGQVAGPCRIVHSPFRLEGCRLFQHGIHRGVIQSLARRPTEAVFFPCVFSGGRVCLFSCFPPESAFRTVARRPPGLGMSLSCGFRAGRMELLVSSVLLRCRDINVRARPTAPPMTLTFILPATKLWRKRSGPGVKGAHRIRMLACEVDWVVWFVDSSVALGMVD